MTPCGYSHELSKARFINAGDAIHIHAEHGLTALQILPGIYREDLSRT